ncbi:hypothetical protein [Endozoicomonas sp. GU-1]|uniref:hypothetical protein n=1 Tax=Endozoicomonas sp. GU-1 TaxID=3009078 RepID=UPI0022B4E33C|nr:hypothetical protein [Endozoicomonas sp. GU-1]WBA83752.1 hypothetical protein O2T12_11855 [Endozoicomonas sp. GU-1]WBA86734.1 hypothetical protein O3276_01430 [Endozoicomonas sp. GU-1]
MSTNRWFIVTNTENLEFFFHCGLIVDKQGFSGNAYIADAMQNSPIGYIPCFPKTNLWDALNASKAEDDNLTECLLEIDTKQITNIFAFYRTNHLDIGKFKPFKIEKEINGNNKAFSELLLPAPLPLSCVKKIILKDNNQQKSIKAKYELFYGKNIGKSVTIEAKLFKEIKTPENNLPFNQESDLAEQKNIGEQVPHRKLNYQKTFSYGGALSLLYYQTKNGRHSTEIFKKFSKNNSQPEQDDNTWKLTALFHTEPEKWDNGTNLYNQIIRLIFDQHNTGEARYSLLELLKRESQPKLVAILEAINDRTHQDPPDTIFKNIIQSGNDKSDLGLTKYHLLLTMFFLRDNIETVLKYYHSNFSEEDYSLFALFFGAIGGFIKTPETIRCTHGLSMWISFKMATYMHLKTHNNLSISDDTLHTLAPFSEPEEPILIYDKYFKKSTTNHKLHDFYEWFSSEIINVPDSEFISWKQNEEYEQKKEGQFFKTRPKTKAEVNYQHLENLIAKKTISDSNDLFSFNSIIDSYKKMLR